MIGPYLNWNSCFSYWILVFVPIAFCYNLDTKFPVLYLKDSQDSYFGFSVGLLQNNGGRRALITAPRANSSVVTKFHQPGVLFSCDIPLSGDTPTCAEVAVGRTGTNKEMDDMWLGVSLDVQPGSKDNNVVVCGHLEKNLGLEHHKVITANGVCYVINRELDSGRVEKLRPLENTRKQIHNSNYYYAFGQAGASVTFSEDGQYLLLGCPGFFASAGNIISYKIHQGFGTPGLENSIVPDTYRDVSKHLLSFYGYAGYSVTSGSFFEQNVLYTAVGAPRDGNHHGRVYIFKPFEETSGQLVVYERKEGAQLGGYFGASVSGIDLNADRLTDLLVGAPLYSEELGGDEGRVYIYISSKVGLQKFAELSGQNKKDARFGTCIGNTGDLNQDGFNDVAIGAPYEDGKGAVYIYQGTTEGLNTHWVQRIGAEEINPSISGFGISISRGLDVDDNSYLDVLIGSYSSSNAVLLRTYPLIQLSSDLQFQPPKINRNIIDCDFKGQNLPCFNITYCLRYSGKHAPSSLEFNTLLKMDSARVGSPTIHRGFIFTNDMEETEKSSVSRTVEVELTGSCFQETAYIHRNIRDEISPVQFFLSYDLYYGPGSVCQNNSFSKNCPVIDPKSSNTVTKSILFQIDCGPDNNCSADLVVEAFVSGNPNDTVLIIGRNNTLTLGATVNNTGETAYAPVLYIRFSSRVPVVKQDLCYIENSLHEQHVGTVLRCELGNSIKTGKAVNTEVTIDLKRIPVSTSSLNVHFEVTTVSEETNIRDNTFDLPISFKAVADIGVTGAPDEEQIADIKEKSAVSVTHKYYVMNYGPSPVDKIDIYLSVPTAVEGKDGLVNFLTFNELEADSDKLSTISAKCDSSQITIIPISNKIMKPERIDLNQSYITDNQTEADDVSSLHVIRKRSIEGNTTDPTEKKGVHVVDCETAKCEEIYCIAGPFPPDGQKSKRISVSVTVNLTVLNSVMEAWERIEFMTKIRISTNVTNVASEQHADEISVKTVIVNELSPLPQEVAKWIIFVSIGVGILLLLISLVVLMKIGFFKRQQREKMKIMMFQASLRTERSRPISNEDEEEAKLSASDDSNTER